MSAELNEAGQMLTAVPLFRLIEKCELENLLTLFQICISI